MTSKQRMESDAATEDRREREDNIVMSNRIKNDESTFERRSIADETTKLNRSKNDDLTAHRRGVKDGSTELVLVVCLSVLLILAVGTFFMLM